MWLKILRRNISHLTRRRAKGSCSVDHHQRNGNNKGNKTNNNNGGAEVNGGNDDQSVLIDNKNLSKKKSIGFGNGPLLHQAEVSSSQVDFFKMLDEKIENGPDYDEDVDITIKTKHCTADLLRRWELTSMLWSPSVNDLNSITNTITTTSMVTTGNTHDEPCKHEIIVKYREGMRNIIGGRPEIIPLPTPVFTRNTNRAVDGLDDINCPSPNISRRHVLESITQSPTQSLKKSLSSSGTSSASYLRQFNDYYADDNNSIVVNKLSDNNIMNYQSANNISDIDNDFDNSQAYYREQYLQRSGIIGVQPQYQSGNIICNNSYTGQFKLSNNDEDYETRKKSNFNVIQMT